MILPYDIQTNETWVAWQLAKHAITEVALGTTMLTMICSPTGFGKTYIAKAILKQHGIRSVPELRPPNEAALVKAYWANRDHPVVLMDDSDGVARGERTCNAMKIAHGKRRVMGLDTVEAMKNEEKRQNNDDTYDPMIPPPWFDLGTMLRLIWLSNLNFTDPRVRGDLPQHFDALISRGLDPIWIPDDAENDGYEVFLYTHWLVTEGNMLRSLQFTYPVARDAIKFYVENVHRFADICPRRLELIAKAMATTDATLRDARLNKMLLASDQRPKLKLPEPFITALLWPETKTKAPMPERERPAARPEARVADPSADEQPRGTDDVAPPEVEQPAVTMASCTALALITPPPKPRRRGRTRGSKNKSKAKTTDDNNT